MSVTLQKGTILTAKLVPFWNACAAVGADLEAAGFHGFSIHVQNPYPEDGEADVRWMNEPLFRILFKPTPWGPERALVHLNERGFAQRELLTFAEWEQFFREELLDPIEDRIIALLRLRRKIDSNAERLLGLLRTVAQEPVEQYTAALFANLR